MRRLSFFFALGAALSTLTGPAHAALSLTVPSATFYTGDGTDSLDIVLTSSDGSDALDTFTLDFQITPNSSNAVTPFGTLRFVSPPPDTLNDKSLTADSYIFKGNSSDTTNDVPFGVTSAGDTQLTVTDSTNLDLLTFSYPDISFIGNKLVARVAFQVPSTTTNLAGDKFDFTLTNPDTAFQSSSSLNSLPLSGLFTGTITVESAPTSPVPEPGTCGMMLAGVVGLVLARRKRHARNGHAEACSAAQARLGV